MANLLGQNIGTNYKGILNLGSTINTALSSTLRAITDGDGVSSPLQLSTAQAVFGGYSTAPIGDIVWRTNPTLTDYTGWHQSDGNYRIMTKNNASLFINISSSILFSNGLSAQSIMSSNGALGLGIAITPSARLHVRGDGTNPIARFETNAGTAVSEIFNSTTYNYTSNIFRAGISNDSGGLSFSALTAAFSSGTNTRNQFAYTYTINNTGGTNIVNGIFLNATETSITGTTHNLMDLQVGGVSRFRVLNSGGVIAEGTSTIPTARMGFINDPTNAVSVFSFTNTTGATTFGGSIFRFNGTTNAFPALKRNGAALEVRLADDSGFANITANDVFVGSQFRNIGLSAATALRYANDEIRASITGNNGVFKIYNPSVDVNVFWMEANGSLSINKGSAAAASAILEVNSTTKGFLPPRMTTTQVNAIATPAEGLVVFNTTISHLCVYQSGAWVRINHSPM